MEVLYLLLNAFYNCEANVKTRKAVFNQSITILFNVRNMSIYCVSQNIQLTFEKPYHNLH